MLGGVVSTWFECAIRRDWKGGELRCGWWCFDVVGGGASTWLEGALRRGKMGCFDVIGGGVSTWWEGGALSWVEGGTST